MSESEVERVEGKIALYGGVDEKVDSLALQALDRLGRENIEVGYAGFMKGRVKMPFIETPEGGRVFGLESILKYVEKQININTSK